MDTIFGMSEENFPGISDAHILFIPVHKDFYATLEHVAKEAEMPLGSLIYMSLFNLILGRPNSRLDRPLDAADMRHIKKTLRTLDDRLKADMQRLGL